MNQQQQYGQNTQNWHNQQNSYDASNWNSPQYYNTWLQKQQIATQSLPHLYGNTNNTSTCTQNTYNNNNKPYYNQYKGGSTQNLYQNKQINTFNAQNTNTQQWPPPPPPPLQTADILNMNKPLNISAITKTVNDTYFNNSDSEHNDMDRSKSADEADDIKPKKKKKKKKKGRTPKILHKASSNKDIWDDYTEEKKAVKQRKKEERKKKKEKKKKNKTPKYDTKKFVKYNYKNEDTSSSDDENVDEILAGLKRKKAEKRGKGNKNKTKKKQKRHQIQKSV